MGKSDHPMGVVATSLGILIKSKMAAISLNGYNSIPIRHRRFIFAYNLSLCFWAQPIH